MPLIRFFGTDDEISSSWIQALDICCVKLNPFEEFLHIGNAGELLPECFFSDVKLEHLQTLGEFFLAIKEGLSELFCKNLRHIEQRFNP